MEDLLNRRSSIQRRCLCDLFRKPRRSLIPIVVRAALLRLRACSRSLARSASSSPYSRRRSLQPGRPTGRPPTRVPARTGGSSLSGFICSLPRPSAAAGPLAAACCASMWSGEGGSDGVFRWSWRDEPALSRFSRKARPRLSLSFCPPRSITVSLNACNAVEANAQLASGY